MIKKHYLDERIQMILESLPEEERELLDYRIGTYGEKPSRNAIAKIMNLTLDRVRGIEKRTLKHLKYAPRIQYMNEVLDHEFHAS